MPEPRQHHYVTRAYLEGFTARDGKLTVLDLGRNTIRRQRPQKVAKRRDYHRVDVAGVPAGDLERQLAELEGNGVAALEKLAKPPHEINANDWSYLLAFVGLHAARVPTVRKIRANAVDELSKTALRFMTATEDVFRANAERASAAGFAVNLGFAEMQEFATGGEFTVAEDQTTVTVADIELAAGITEQLIRRNWAVVVGDRGAGDFVCSDRPVSVGWSGPRQTGWFGPGFGLAGTDVTFPLCNNVALLGRLEPLPNTILATTAVVAGVNSRTARGANEVYASTSDFCWVDSANSVRAGGLLAAWEARSVAIGEEVGEQA